MKHGTKIMTRLIAGVALAACGSAMMIVQSGPAAAQSKLQPSHPRMTANPGPDRQAGEGAGPFNKLVIRGVTVIDGTGAPPIGPMDIVIENNVIAEMIYAGTPGLPLKPDRAPRDFDYELDATGMFVMPGFIDMHVHGSTSDKAPDLSYAYKLWLAHGVTTVRGVDLTSFEMSLSERARSARNQIVAPRIFAYQRPGQGDGWTGGLPNTPEKARAWVQWAAKAGIDGIKLNDTPDQPPEVMEAIIDEAKKLNLGTTAHLMQFGVGRFNAVQAGEAGLGTVTHFYGHFESLLKNGPIQNWSHDYNFRDEQSRFGEVANLYDESFDAGSPEWWDYLEKQKENNVTFDPTMTIYIASRDLMRAQNADWHDKYTMPQLWNFFQSSRINHGSYFYDWTLEREVKWKNFYHKYMQLINDYKKIGGRVTTGSDSGFIFQPYGFGYIQELELLQEAGFNPTQVLQAATLNGALTLYEPKGQPVPPIGAVRVGKLADLVIVKENPLQNLKTLYGTGALRLNEETQQLERVGGVSYTVKDGIVYDAKKLLADVAEMVITEKRKMGLPETGLPRH